MYDLSCIVEAFKQFIVTSISVDGLHALTSENCTEEHPSIYEVPRDLITC